MRIIAAIATDFAEAPLIARVRSARLASRLALGIVWLYEGIVPKILFAGLHPEQTMLVAHSGIYWHSPESTLVVLGALQAILGVILLVGWRERLAALTASVWMLILIVLVASGRPELLTDPFGALVKDTCLLACAFVVWLFGGNKWE